MLILANLPRRTNWSVRFPRHRLLQEKRTSCASDVCCECMVRRCTARALKFNEGIVCANVSGVSPDTPIVIKSGVLGCSFNNVKSQLGGFPFELCGLSLAVLGLVEFRSLVYAFHSVAEPAVDQSRQLGGHGFDGSGGAELGSESAKWRSQIGVAYP